MITEEDKKDPAEVADTVGSVAKPTGSKTGEDLAKKEFPAPAALKPEAPKAANILSKVLLSDIPLPPNMKGPVPGVAPATTSREAAALFAVGEGSEIERSMREIGIKTPPRGEKRIVAIAKEHRTEIDENGLPRLHTYAQDVSEEIRKRGATLATIVGAERERAVAREASLVPARIKIPTRNVAFIVGAALLVVLGGGALITVFIISSRKETAQGIESGIIYANKTARIELGNDPLVTALTAERETATLSLGEVERIVPTKNDVEMSPKVLLTELGAPDVLARNAKRVMLGVHAFDRNQPFIIVETNYYDITFDAMLAWEGTIAETLGDFFRPVTNTMRVPGLHFTDGIFKNIDVRMSERSWSIIYAFPGRDLLIITTNENTLAEILTRRSVSVR